MKELMILGFLLLLVVGFGALELYRHKIRLATIPVRIHVNGTRGKSSVTRLIAAGLRAGGMVTSAKTTGTLPRMIQPDGSELPVYRKSRPNIIEQIRIISHAAALKSQAIVIECMALQPYLQWLSEDKLVRATHGVITNVRADHLEVMGPDENGVARALAGMIPQEGKLFTGEEKHLGFLREASADRNSRVIASADCGITDEDLGKFSYIEHRENVCLALTVCEALGVEKQTALGGMQQMQPDPGATTAYEMNFFGRHIVFVNGFAANDPFSTEKIWNLSVNRFGKMKKRIMIVNCRIDRPERSQQLGDAIVGWTQPDVYVAIGTGTHIFARTAMRNGIELSRIVMSEDIDPVELFEKVIELSGESALVAGMGNIGDNGLSIVRYFKNRSREVGMV